jgi:hypothetical protein
MTRFRDSFFGGGAALAAGIALVAAACSSDGGGEEPLPEGTGAIVAALSNVPNDVRCVDVQTSSPQVPLVRTDVTPGAAATVRIAPLFPGSILLSGTAYDEPCSSIGQDGSFPSATWQAQPTTVFVEAGRTTHAQLKFYRGTELQVEIEFVDPSCACDAGPGGNTGGDAGSQYWPDGSPPSRCPCPIQEGLDAGPPGLDAAP